MKCTSLFIGCFNSYRPQREKRHSDRKLEVQGYQSETATELMKFQRNKNLTKELMRSSTWLIERCCNVTNDCVVHESSRTVLFYHECNKFKYRSRNRVSSSSCTDMQKFYFLNSFNHFGKLYGIIEKRFSKNLEITANCTGQNSDFCKTVLPR